MNDKVTNRLVAILDGLVIIAFGVLLLFSNFLLESFIKGTDGGTSIYNSYVIDLLLNNIETIYFVTFGTFGLINIVCGIQNRKNKKVCFWQLTFGVCYIWNMLGMIISDSTFFKCVNVILYSIIPILLAIYNIIRIKKNKPKPIQVVSYVCAIILSVLGLLGIIDDFWPIVAVIMQLIYIHYQDKNIKNSKSRRIINLILYYAVQLVVAICVFAIILSAVAVAKFNENKWEEELFELTEKISTLHGAKKEELYIPVENNKKYGFINEEGEEKISCQYDFITYFNEIKLGNDTYYIALAKKDNEFLIISKSEDSIVIEGYLEKYLANIDNSYGALMREALNADGDYRRAYLNSFWTSFYVLTKQTINMRSQTVNKEDTELRIALERIGDDYYYKNNNYEMIIKVLDEYEHYDGYYDDDVEYYDDNDGVKYNVTIVKSNGERHDDVVYLNGFDEREETITIFSNGYIEFESEDCTQKGWYDNYGNPQIISGDYDIEEFKEDNVILFNEKEDENDNVNYEFIVIDENGKTLLQTAALKAYNNFYLVKNKNGKMVLMNNNLNVISDDYDKIIVGPEIDLNPIYSFYY